MIDQLIYDVTHWINSCSYHHSSAADDLAITGLYFLTTGATLACGLVINGLLCKIYDLIQRGLWLFYCALNSPSIDN